MCSILLLFFQSAQYIRNFVFLTLKPTGKLSLISMRLALSEKIQTKVTYSALPFHQDKVICFWWLAVDLRKKQVLLKMETRGNFLFCVVVFLV